MDVMLPTFEVLDRLTDRSSIDEMDAATRSSLVRTLRLTPLSVLMARRAKLVTALALMPETDRVLRPTWERQDRLATAQLYIWVEGARRRRSRDTGHRSASRDEREHDCFPVIAPV